MTFVSVPEAARLIKRDRKVLYRDYIATGKLSASKNARGRMQIDLSELIRVFGSAVIATDVTENSVAMSQTETVNVAEKTAPGELEKLRVEVAELRARLEEKDANLADLRQAMKLLEHKKDTEKRRRWWPF
jgi:hypothetical protein